MLEASESHSFLGMPVAIRSRAMLQILSTVERVARTNATVLITGESGSGKEVIARAVHHYSIRCNRPWVDVSCAALPEHLVESELFGYEKGAFSGAAAMKQGLFELAHQGTLFLDEIGELEPKMQVKLLRVLDGTPYYRLGGVRKISVDVRIVAATNQDLDGGVQSGRFRGDLFHRLSQIHLTVPPLRQRTEDIVPIAELFLQQYGSTLTLSKAAVKSLLDYHWPGNIRELRNVIMKASVLADGTEILPHDLPLETSRPLEQETAPVNSGRRPTSLPGNGFDPGASNMNLDQMERKMILHVLEQTAWHHQRAAKLLGISRRTLTRKLRLYALESAQQDCVA